MISTRVINSSFTPEINQELLMLRNKLHLNCLSNPDYLDELCKEMLKLVDRQMSVDDLPQVLETVNTDQFKKYLEQEAAAIEFASENKVIHANSILNTMANDIEKVLIAENMAYAYAKAGNLEQLKEMLNLLCVTFRFSAVKANLAYYFACSEIRIIRDQVDILIANSISLREKNHIFVNAAEGFAVTKQYTLAHKYLNLAPEKVKAEALYAMLFAFSKINDETRVRKLTNQNKIKTDSLQIALFTLAGYIVSGNKTKIDAYLLNINADILVKIIPKLAFYLAANNKLSYFNDLIAKTDSEQELKIVGSLIQGYASKANVDQIYKLIVQFNRHSDVTFLCKTALYAFAKYGYMQLANQLLNVLNEDIEGSLRHQKFLESVLDGMVKSRCFVNKATSLNALSTFQDATDSRAVAEIFNRISRSTTFSINSLYLSLRECKGLISRKAVNTSVQAFTWVSMQKEVKEVYLLLCMIAHKKSLSPEILQIIIQYLIPTHMNSVEKIDFSISIQFNRAAFFKKESANAVSCSNSENPSQAHSINFSMVEKPSL
jgi:hypothetical protein